MSKYYTLDFHFALKLLLLLSVKVNSMDWKICIISLHCSFHLVQCIGMLMHLSLCLCHCLGNCLLVGQVMPPHQSDQISLNCVQFSGMVWYGMVSYGMVWYIIIWYGMVRHGEVWYGMAWYGQRLHRYTAMH